MFRAVKAHHQEVKCCRIQALWYNIMSKCIWYYDESICITYDGVVEAVMWFGASNLRRDGRGMWQAMGRREIYTGFR